MLPSLMQVNIYDLLIFAQAPGPYSNRIRSRMHSISMCTEIVATLNSIATHMHGLKYMGVVMITSG